MAVKKETVQDEATPKKFSKAEILNAKKYHDKKDLVKAVLPDDFDGTIAEVDSEIEKYMKGKVK